MHEPTRGTPSTPELGSGRPPPSLPRWGVALIAGMAAVALALGVTLQAEVSEIQSSESVLGSRQLFGGTVNVSDEVVPGNTSAGYSGGAAFPAPTGNGNPIVVRVAIFESGGFPVTLEFDICSESQPCLITGGSLDIVPITPELSEAQVVLEPAAGFYDLNLLNLPGYANGFPVMPLSVQVNVTLLGQLDFHS
jgi:hypothetical protein